MLNVITTRNTNDIQSTGELIPLFFSACPVLQFGWMTVFAFPFLQYSAVVAEETIKVALCKIFKGNLSVPIFFRCLNHIFSFCVNTSYIYNKGVGKEKI